MSRHGGNAVVNAVFYCARQMQKSYEFVQQEVQEKIHILLK
jgi:hypothetical protein